ncbi:hypothetical protein DNK56_22480 [Streptomyces sp. AC1-42W]|nr:hypothetical protein DNK56_22480 [Streptomyces sp. AC1-42W]
MVRPPSTTRSAESVIGMAKLWTSGTGYSSSDARSPTGGPGEPGTAAGRPAGPPRCGPRRIGGRPGPAQAATGGGRVTGVRAGHPVTWPHPDTPYRGGGPRFSIRGGTAKPTAGRHGRMDAQGTAQGKAQELFRFMLDHPDWTPESARRGLGFSRIDLELAQHLLLEAGLLRTTRDKAARPTTVEPAVAVARLLAMEEDDARSWMASVHERRTTLTALGSKMMRLQAQADTDTQVKLLTGQEPIATALNGVSVTAQQEILSMHPGSPLPRTVLEDSMDRNRAALERGVVMRSLHLEAMNKVPSARAHLEALEDLGCHVRLTPALPFRLILVDGVLAYVSAPATGSQLSALEIRGQEICWLLRQVFEHCWLHGRAVPRGESAVQEVDLSDRERAVLRMLAAGYTDESVARALGISTRTLRRMTTVILEKIGARSRFEAGVRAAMLELVETSPGGPADL